MRELHNTYIVSACNYIAHALNTLNELMNWRHTTLNRTLIIMVSIFALIALVGAASATDYYLATTGNNNENGASLETAWATPSYAVAQISAGDTLWVVDGTYTESNEIEIEAEQFGSEGNWVRVRAYNGAPIWDGNGVNEIGFLCGESSDSAYTPAYVELDGIHIKRFGYSASIQNVCNVVIRNCTFENSSVALPTWRSLLTVGSGVHSITIDNCSFIDSGDFGIDLMGDRYGTTYKTYDVTISDCYFEDMPHHSALQMCEYIDNITAIGNTVVDCYDGIGTYFHEVDNPRRASNIIIKNNNITNTTAGYGISFVKTIDSLIMNNTIHNCDASDAAGIAIADECNNITVKDNVISKALHVYDDCHSGYPNIFITYEGNTYSDIRAREIGFSYEYYQRAGGMLVLRNEIPRCDDGQLAKFGVEMSNEDTKGTAIVEYTDGRVFDYSLSGSDYLINCPKWYPDKSKFTLESSNPVSVDITPYDITLHPTSTHGHLHDVTVDIWDDISGTYRITASSTESENPTWINLTTKDASTTYDITRDGASCTATTGADGILRYHIDEWDGPQTIEFSYASDRKDPAPCIINLRNDTPTQDTVTLRWDCSAPDMDYYTIHRDGALLDTTESQYYSATNLAPDTTYTLEVSATKDEITGDGVNIIVKTAAEEVDPAPCVINLRNDTPTQDTVTLRWDCSTPDMDYYTTHRDGALLDTTESQYYSATNLAPDTTYTFEVSATKYEITGDSVGITVRTVAEEAEDSDSNLIIIDNYAKAYPDQSVAVPIMIQDATEVACYGLNLTYDADVVTVTNVTQGDFTTYFGCDNESAADGWVTVNTYVSETSLTGDVKIAEVTLKAVGGAGDTSPLDMEIISVADQNGYPVPGTVRNGLFTVVGDVSPPFVTDPSASQLIPDDTDGVPSWGETATLNVTVTDESDIAGVVIDLSAIGGSTVQPMTHIGNNIWSVTTNASAGTPPKTYDLPVCATDIHGYVNMSESVELVVMRNGDVTGDDDLTPDDVALLANYVTYPGRYTISSEFVADVTDDGVVDIADAMMLANYVASPDRRTLRFVGSTC